LRQDALTAFFTFTIRSISQGSPSRGCLSTKVAIELDPESPRQRAALKKMFDLLESALMKALDTPEARAQLAISPEQATAIIVTMTRGIAVMERVYSDPKRLRQTTAALVDTLLRKT